MCFNYRKIIFSVTEQDSRIINLTNKKIEKHSFDHTSPLLLGASSLRSESFRSVLPSALKNHQKVA